MTNQNSNPNNALSRRSSSELKKYDNPAVQIASAIVKVEESVKTLYSQEVNKSIIIKTEFEVWDEYDRKS